MTVPPANVMPSIFAAAAAAAAGSAAQPSTAFPEGAEQRVDGSAAIRSECPDLDLLNRVSAHNKRGVRGAKLMPAVIEIKHAGETAELPVPALWAALRAGGGIHLVRPAASWQQLLLSVFVHM